MDIGKIPFKEPFLDMFEDIKEKLEADPNTFSESTIIELFQNTTETLTQDCQSCKNYPEIVAVCDHTNQVSLKLGSMLDERPRRMIEGNPGTLSRASCGPG